MAKKQIIRGGQKGVVPMVGKKFKTKLIGAKKGVAPAGGGGGN